MDSIVFFLIVTVLCCGIAIIFIALELRRDVEEINHAMHDVVEALKDLVKIWKEQYDATDKH